MERHQLCVLPRRAPPRVCRGMGGGTAPSPSPAPAWLPFEAEPHPHPCPLEFGAVAVCCHSSYTFQREHGACWGAKHWGQLAAPLLLGGPLENPACGPRARPGRPPVLRAHPPAAQVRRFDRCQHSPGCLHRGSWPAFWNSLLWILRVPLWFWGSLRVSHEVGAGFSGLILFLSSCPSNSSGVFKFYLQEL